MRRENYFFLKGFELLKILRWSITCFFIFISLSDVDECSTGSHSCRSDGACVNAEGTYSCDCGPGLKWNLNKMRCQGNTERRRTYVNIYKCRITEYN